MNTTKKLLCILTAGTALGVAAPVFADSYHDRGYDHYRHSAHHRDFDRHSYRNYERHVYRDYVRHHPVVVHRPLIVQRPYIIEQPVYYAQPAPMPGIVMGAMIGAAIGGIIDSRQ